MNGDVNPNANVMSNFGKQNFMQSGGGGGPDMYDLLPKDPLAPKKPKWLIESEQMHQKKQAQIQAEQDQFVPQSFKQSGAMNLDIKGNKSQGKAKTWLDNNSNINNSNQQQSQSQNNYNNNNNNGFNGNNNYNNNNNDNMNNNMNNYSNGNNNEYGNNNNMNNGNNFGGNNNMNNDNMNNYGGNNNMNNSNDYGGNNNGFGGNNNNNYGNNNNFPNNNNMNSPNNMNNGGYGGNHNNNNNVNNNNNNNYGGNQHQNQSNNNNQYQNQHQMNAHKKPMEQPVSQPYGNNQKADPFANMQYQRDFTNYGRPKQGKYQDLSKYGQSRSHQDTGNNNYSGPIASANKYQDMQSRCHYCKKPVGDKWTEDAKQRQYHDECFTCIICGAVLGQLGKYVTTGNGVVCKPCRNQQILAAQAAEQHY